MARDSRLDFRSMFGSFSFTELFFIFVLALLLFWPRKLPELGKSIGQALGQFKRASEDFKRSWEEEVELEKRRPVEPPRRAEGSVARSEAEPVEPDAERDRAHATLPSVEEVARPEDEKVVDRVG